MKWKNDRYGGGVCTLKDARTKTDFGRRCHEFKRIPYKRENNSSELAFAVKSEEVDE